MLLFGVVSYEAAILLGRCQMLFYTLLDDERYNYDELEIKLKL